MRILMEDGQIRLVYEPASDPDITLTLNTDQVMCSIGQLARLGEMIGAMMYLLEPYQATVEGEKDG